ncbi:MAG: hypothetical protein BWY50_00432 [Spirochaetes bacterium ADurb.Bin315]|nr:MAG: hypothetical protein BWY50_00432 [Spirochaetes bacterium ADurb.Bin315]
MIGGVLVFVFFLPNSGSSTTEGRKYPFFAPSSHPVRMASSISAWESGQDRPTSTKTSNMPVSWHIGIHSFLLILRFSRIASSTAMLAFEPTLLPSRRSSSSRAHSSRL